MKIRIIGSGEAFDSRFGNTACLLSGRDIPVILFDAGYQIPERIWKLRPAPEIDVIWISHLHADHTFGLVPLLARYWEDRRIKPIHVIGPEGLRDMLERVLELGYPGLRARFPFELTIDEVRDGGHLDLGKLELSFARSNHSVVNLAVKLEDRQGVSFAYSGDGAINDATRSLFQGTDLLIHECYSWKAVTPIHTHLESLIEFVGGQESRIGRIGITHVSVHFRKEVVREIERLTEMDSRWFMAQPGMILDVRKSHALRAA